LLGHERTNIAGIGGSKRELQRLKAMAAARQFDGKPLLEDALIATRIAQVEIDLTALEITNLRVIFDAEQKKAPGPEASMLKIRGTEIRQRIAELQVDVLGADALAFDGHGDSDDVPRAMADYLNLRKLSIYGGSNEIQRNIIAQMILRLRG
jgi:alkylation response protein AidB-like acyl-CoA dehydrogenase